MVRTGDHSTSEGIYNSRKRRSSYTYTRAWQWGANQNTLLELSLANSMLMTSLFLMKQIAAESATIIENPSTELSHTVEKCTRVNGSVNGLY